MHTERVGKRFTGKFNLNDTVKIRGLPFMTSLSAYNVITRFISIFFIGICHTRFNLILFLKIAACHHSSAAETPSRGIVYSLAHSSSATLTRFSLNAEWN